MTTNDVSDTRISTELLQQIIDGCEGVTPGPWWSDSERSEGGSGSFDAYAVYGPERFGRPSSICDTHNAGEIALEQDDDRPWDEQGRKNMAHVARLDPATVKAIAELALSALASRTQSPAEWEDGFVAEYEVTNAVEAYRHAYPDGSSRAGQQGMRAALEGFAYQRATIPAPERSKEETSFGVDAAEDEVRKLLHPKKEPDENGFIIGEPVEKFTGEARWEGVLVASYLTTKGQRRYVVEVKPQGFQMIAVPAQLRMIAALETPPLHKEGEAAWYEWELGDEKPEGSVEVRWRYGDHGEQTYIGDAASIGWQYVAWWRPAPVPVTITDEPKRVPHEVALAGFYEAQKAEVKAKPLYDQCCSIYQAMRAAALSLKPGEQG